MRVLLLNDSPLDGSLAGKQTRGLLESLRAAGHQVRVLLGDRAVPAPQHSPSAEAEIHRVVCQADEPAADLPIALPCFTVGLAGTLPYWQLTDAQIAAYRNVFREHLDREVSDFDPHLIHVQHLWVLGELTLEAGVPYVISAHSEELSAYRDDARYRALSDQAAENAGRILVGSEALRDAIVQQYPHVASDRIFVAPMNELIADAARLTSLYQQVLIERFGSLPDADD